MFSACGIVENSQSGLNSQSSNERLTIIDTQAALNKALGSEIFAVVDGPGDSDQDGVWVLSQPHAIIQADSREQLQEQCAAAEELTRTLHTILLLDYELGYWLEPASAADTKTLGAAPFTAVAFTSAQWIEQQDFDAALDQWTAALPEQEQSAGIMNVQRSLELDDYRKDIAQVLENISEGNCYQINLTWPLSFDIYGNPVALYRRLRRRQAVKHGALVRIGGRTILSLSPELFLERKGKRITARPMKGTAQRGHTAEEDQQRASSLQKSVKDRAENVMIVDLIRNDLGRVARPGTVKVESLFKIETYSTILQMVSEVSAEVEKVSLYELLRALFPCGSITGAPKIRAMRLIQELEKTPRHLYTGSIGHWYPGGDFTVNVAIRTLELDADGHGRLGIGSGIVADSDADQEYAECLAKANFVTALPANFELLETLCFEQGHFPYLQLHLDRLERSARTFGFQFLQENITEALRQATAGTTARSRVRLTLTKNGESNILCTPLAPTRQIPRVVISDHVLESGNIFLQHKTTMRGVYDKVLQQLTTQGEYFDALFFNERKELCEGARSNIFVVKNKVWYTPPLSCGVLNGVMRQVQMSRTDIRVEEKILRLADLLEADQVYLTNAVRGVVACDLITGKTGK